MKLPKALKHYDDWKAVTITGPARALILSDLHIPYHAEEAIQAAVSYGKNAKANLILINGDLADFFGLSTWEKDPRKRNLLREVDACREFLDALRDEFPKARIVLKEGNHEERWERFFKTKAPELLGLNEFEWREVFGLSKRKIEYVGDRRPIRLGKINIIHGHEYRFNISNPVNPARGLFLRGKSHAICGHFHQSSQHSEKCLDDRIVSTWSAGCLCDMHPDYAPINNWNHGFILADITETGLFQINNARIIEGKVYA